MPQTLVYLIEDVARRYGEVQVHPTGCRLRSDDETCLPKSSTRALQALHLVRLAPTVLASAKPQAETLAVLRAAGHAPAVLRTDGSPAIEIPQRRRAALPPNQPHSGDMVALPRLSDPAEIAPVLLSNCGWRLRREGADAHGVAAADLAV